MELVQAVPQALSLSSLFVTVFPKSLKVLRTSTSFVKAADLMHLFQCLRRKHESQYDMLCGLDLPECSSETGRVCQSDSISGILQGQALSPFTVL